MGRAPCCDKGSVKKGPWSPEEDRKLKEYIDKYGTGGNWIALPTKAGLRRCGKSCRLRWLNYLRPNIKHGDFSDHEDRIICNLFATIGSRWSIIAAQLPGRTDNDIKNYWNTRLKKKLMGLPPTHRSKPPATANHHHQLFFPADPPALADAAIPAPQHHPFSLQHLGAAPHYSSSYSPSCSSLPTAGGGGSLLMFGGGGDQYQHHMSSCSDNGGLYFELCNNSSGSVGLESFIFGGLQLQEDTTTQAKLFPAHNNTSGSMLEMDHHHQYGGSSSSSSNSNSNAAACYEHEMKPLPMILPSGSGTSSFFYGEAAGASQGRFLY